MIIARFSGKPADLASFEAAFLLLLKSDDEALFDTFIEDTSKRPKPVIKSADFFKRVPTFKPSGNDAHDMILKHDLAKTETKMRLYMALLLPSDFIVQFQRTTTNTAPIHKIWNQFLRTYGGNHHLNAIEVYIKFINMVNADFNDFGAYLRGLSGARNASDSKCIDGSSKPCITDDVHAFALLSQLPSHLYAGQIAFNKESLSLEKLEPKLLSIFGNRSRHDIMMMGASYNNSTSIQASGNIRMNNNRMGSYLGKRNPNFNHQNGKRKANQGGRGDVKRHQGQQGAMTPFCYYCRGKYGKEPHFKADCPKKAEDLKSGFARSDIFSKSTPIAMAKPSGRDAARPVNCNRVASWRCRTPCRCHWF